MYIMSALCTFDSDWPTMSGIDPVAFMTLWRKVNSIVGQPPPFVFGAVDKYDRAILKTQMGPIAIFSFL